MDQEETNLILPCVNEDVVAPAACIEVDTEAVTSEADVTVITTLSDGSVVQVVPCGQEEIAGELLDDQNLHDAARIILECAENSRISAHTSNAGSAAVEVAETVQEVVTDANPSSQKLEFDPDQPITVLRFDDNPKKGICTGCQKIVEYKNRKRHLSVIHKVKEECASKTAKCIHPDCEEEFYMVKSMMRHLEEFHGVQVETKELYFPSWEEFLTWKCVEEDTNFVYFSKRNGDCVRGNKTITYYVCQRDGSKRPHRGKNYVPTERKHKKGRVKTDLTCPARIKAYRNANDESVRVVYTFSHNHTISPRDTVHQPLSRNKLAKIKSKLQQGVNSDTIHSLMNSVSASDVLDPVHMVSKRRIDGIKKKLDRDNRLSPEECASVHLLVKRLQELEDSPIALYECRGVFEHEGHIYTEHLFEPSKLFLVLYQSPAQLEIMKAFGNNALILDTDGTMDNNRNQLLNILVADEFEMAYPVAHIITNNMDLGLRLAFQKLIGRVPWLTLNLLFTPHDPTFAKALGEVFQRDQVRYYIGRWETIRQWEKRIRQSIFSSTIRHDLGRLLSMLLSEPYEERFESLLEDFMKIFRVRADRFLRYFDKHYVYDLRAWAVCYRDFPQFGTDRVDFMKKFFTRLEWWSGERSPNKRVDDLINLLSRIDSEWSAQRQLDLGNPPEVKTMSAHELSIGIDDSRVQTIKLHGTSIWVVSTERHPDKSFVVKKIENTCENDFCWDRCSFPECSELCSHLYSCNCDDGTGLCEHIHKVRTCSGNETRSAVESEVVIQNVEECGEDVMSFMEVLQEDSSDVQVLTIPSDVLDQIQSSGSEEIVLYMPDVGEDITDAQIVCADPESVVSEDVL